MRSHAARWGLVFSFVSVGLTGTSSLASASGFEAHRLWSVRGDQQEGAKFGSAVASAGDVNGDGRPDLIVGAPGHDGAAGPACGKVFVYYNSAAGLPSSPSWSAEGEQAGSRFGEAVASAGDVNGDGFDDIVIGSPGLNLIPPEYHLYGGGRLYVYFGSAQGLSLTPASVVDGGHYDLGYVDGIGTAVAAGDFNGDGYADVVGAQTSAHGIGAAAVFYGSAGGVSAVDSWGSAGRWGDSLGVGDVNGDGYDDPVVTSFDHESYIVYAFLYFGSPTGLLPGTPTTGPPGQLVDWGSVMIGDLDRDGIDDVVAIPVRTPSGDSLFPYQAVYRGSATGPGQAKPLAGVFDPLGRLALLGDVNGDGFPDFVAQDRGNPGAPDLGTFVFQFGSATGFRPLSEGMGALAGVIAAARDVNGDGYDDIVVGEAANERVTVYRGGTDWSFRATADVSVAQVVGVSGEFDITVSNAGPDTVRVRLVDHFPPALGTPGWSCLWSGSSTATCLNYQQQGGGGSGDIDEVVTLSPGGSITFSSPWPNPAYFPVANTASIVLPDWVVDPDLTNNQSTVVFGPAQDALFADGFESGGFSAWSSTSGSGVAVVPGAALEGSYGLQVRTPSSGAAVVRDDTPNGEGAYHARFRFDPNGFGSHGGGGAAAARAATRTILFNGHSLNSSQPRFEAVLAVERGKLYLVGRAAVDGGTMAETARAALTDAPHVIDVGWRRATGPGANNGLFVLEIDGAPAGTLSGLDNDAGGGLDSVELGLATSGTRPPPGPHRTVFADSFESWRLQ